jgi:hypothetical protein
MSIRRGDRVMLKTAAGEVMVKELKWRTASLIALRSIPLTSPATVAYFCRPHVCSMSVNGHAFTKARCA